MTLKLKHTILFVLSESLVKRLIRFHKICTQSHHSIVIRLEDRFLLLLKHGVLDLQLFNLSLSSLETKLKIINHAIGRFQLRWHRFQVLKQVVYLLFVKSYVWTISYIDLLLYVQPDTEVVKVEWRWKHRVCGFYMICQLCWICIWVIIEINYKCEVLFLGLTLYQLTDVALLVMADVFSADCFDRVHDLGND
jgi:hypothetical protein